MLLPGHVQNGVVVFDKGLSLPEGMKVHVVPLRPEPVVPLRGTGNWEAATKAAHELRNGGYDFDAWRSQREFDRQHAADHLP